MLRVTVERVGPDGVGTPIGRAVVGRWAGRHIASLVDDRHPPKVGAVDGHDPDEGVWALVRDAVASCLDDDRDLSEAQLARLERQLRSPRRQR